MCTTVMQVFFGEQIGVFFPVSTSCISLLLSSFLPDKKGQHLFPLALIYSPPLEGTSMFADILMRYFGQTGSWNNNI